MQRHLSAFVAVCTLFVTLLAATGGEWVTHGAYYPVPTATPGGGGSGGGGGGGGSGPSVRPPVGGGPSSVIFNPARSGSVGTGPVRVDVPEGAVSGPDELIATLTPMTPGGMSQPAALPPRGTRFGSVAFDFTLRDRSGHRVTELSRAATIRVTYADADLATPGNSVADLRLVVLHEPTGAWVDIQAVADPTSRSLTAYVTHTSLFALVVDLPKPVLRGPADSMPSGYSRLLEWTNPPGTTQYHLQVTPYNDDGPGIDLIRNVEENYQVEAPVLGGGPYVVLPGMTYTWRVRTSRASAGPGPDDRSWSNWVESTFRTPPASSAGIWFVTPKHEGRSDGYTPTLTWSNREEGIFYYEVQVSRAEDFGPSAFLHWALVHGGTADPLNSYRVPSEYPLEPATRYYWRVRPRVQGDGEPVAWSQVWMFETP